MIRFFSILKNIFKIFFLKIRYLNKISITAPRNLSNCDIQISDGYLQIGNSFSCRKNCMLLVKYHGNLILGKNVFFNKNVSITCLKKIIIGNNVKIANNVVIVDHDHDYKNDMTKYKKQDICIGNNVWIGANVVILKGTIIGDNSVIGAGSVVKGIYNPNSIIVGNPGKTIKNWKEEIK